MSRLEAQQVTLAYGDAVIVDGLSVAIPDGQITSIIGPNGCGKSTLLRGLARLLRPRDGAVILDGQAIHHHRPSRNPLARLVRRLSISRSLRVLERIQPASGGYLEAAPLTSFVVMALSSNPKREQGSAKNVIDAGVRFLLNSVRPDGSWPIDTNLSVWVTTLAVNALAAAGTRPWVAQELRPAVELLEAREQPLLEVFEVGDDVVHGRTS